MPAWLRLFKNLHLEWLIAGDLQHTVSSYQLLHCPHWKEGGKKQVLFIFIKLHKIIVIVLQIVYYPEIVHLTTYAVFIPVFCTGVFPTLTTLCILFFLILYHFGILVPRLEGCFINYSVSLYSSVK